MAAVQGAVSENGVVNAEINYESIHEALAQPLLLEKIMDYAIRNDEGNLCADNIRSLRLVQKNWLRAVSKVLRDNWEPLFKLNLDQEDNLKLDQFVDYWTTRKGANGAVPTFRLTILEEFFRQENYESLLNCLRKCGAGLVEVDLHVPTNGGSLTGILPQVILPVLQNLRIEFTDNSLPNLEDEDPDVYNALNITCLFQSLLNGNASLKELTISGYSWYTFHPFPRIQYIPLPSALTTIDIRYYPCEQNQNVLELLTRNHLPNLRSLTFGSSLQSTFSPGILVQVFENVCKTLRFLKLTGATYLGPPRITHLLSFPKMEKLETLEMVRVSFELEREISVLDALFPKLEDLVLYDQTPEMLQKWMTGTVVSSVTDLTLELVDEGKPMYPCNTLPLTLEAMQSAHCRFPNIRILTLQISGTETSGLEYIFKEMRQLTELHITLVGAESLNGSDYWDSLLIGAPIEFVVGLGACPQFWNKVKLENEEDPSLKMLQELTTLTLEEITDEDNLNAPLISDLAFLHGFLRMSNLNQLNFNGRFKASQDMTSEWTKTGHKIEYL